MTLPYYPRYTQAFLQATTGWPLELKGAYAVLLDLIYLNNDRLPDDPQYIAGNLGCSVRKWNQIRAELLARGKLILRLSEDNLQIISNKRAEKEAIKLRRYADKQRENGAKAHENKDLPDANAEPKAPPKADAKPLPPPDNAREIEDKERKEEEGARAREAENFILLRSAVGLDPAAPLTRYWQDDAVEPWVTRWRKAGLTDDQILAEAKASRAKNPEPPEGPKALNAWMLQAATNRTAASAPLPEVVKAQAAPKVHMSPEKRLQDWADRINGNDYIPPSMITNTMRDALLAAGLVTRERLRERQIY